ncbi:hypothetical protein K1719_001034 [Acacia pycnantha]|nr:hypothetical protein K1719_001034 [Acacia pycnantha]
MEASSALSVSPIMYALVLKVKAPPVVTVTGTMDANKLVDYVYRCTKKQANIVPQPEPEPEKKEEPKEAKEAKAEEKKEENTKKKEEEKPAAEKPKKEEEGDKEVGEDKSENKEQKRGVI